MRFRRKFQKLTIARRRVFFLAAGWVVLVQSVLWLLPFRKVRGTVARWAKGKPHDPVLGMEMADITWAVEAAGRYLPWRVTCLVKALAAYVLLTRAGVRPVVRIGVARNPEDGVAAHAWIEVDGRVILGEAHQHERFSPLQPLEVCES